MDNNLTIYEITNILLNDTPSSKKIKNDINIKLIYIICAIFTILYLILYFLIPKFNLYWGILYYILIIITPISYFIYFILKYGKDFKLNIRKDDIAFYEETLIKNNMINKTDIIIEYFDNFISLNNYYNLDILSMILSALISKAIDKIMSDLLFSSIIFINIFIILKIVIPLNNLFTNNLSNEKIKDIRYAKSILLEIKIK